MTAQTLPNELLAHIIGCVESPKAARLVCQLWDKLAIPHAFRTVVLRPRDNAWGVLLDNKRIKHAIRHVVIYSHDTKARTHTGHVPRELTEALPRIKELGLVEDISLNFFPVCYGEQSTQNGMIDHEEYQTRVDVFEAVFSVIRERSCQPNMTRIRSFSANNMQNAPIPTFISSDLFKFVIKNIDELHLNVTEEHGAVFGDTPLQKVERVTFEPWLQQNWLMPIADHIKTLSLSFGLNWGTAPGTFNGRGLTFPQLESLKLGNFTISHYDHFDWVLNQTTLKSLQLDDCYIATVLRLDEKIESWDLDLRDWEILPWNSLFSTWGETFFFPGTWERVFDKISASLPQLVDFQFRHRPRYTWPSDDPSPTPPSTTSLSDERYTAFCEQQGWLKPSWPFSFSRYSEYLETTEFTSGHLPNMSPSHQAIIYRPKSTEKGDRRALQKLLEQIQKHQRLLRPAT